MNAEQAANLRARVAELMALSPEQQELFNINMCSYCAGIGEAFHLPEVDWCYDFGIPTGDGTADYLFHYQLHGGPFPYDTPTGPEGIAEFADRVENVIQALHDDRAPMFREAARLVAEGNECHSCVAVCRASPRRYDSYDYATLFAPDGVDVLKNPGWLARLAFHERPHWRVLALCFMAAMGTALGVVVAQTAALPPVCPDPQRPVSLEEAYQQADTCWRALAAGKLLGKECA